MPFFASGQHRLHYRELGSGPLLLILHGNTASSAHHQGELDYFGKRFHAVAPDFLGCGQSERLDIWPIDWWVQAGRDAAALAHHLGEQQAFVMGTSGGAVAALWMAIQFPASVRAVIADSLMSRMTPERAEAALHDRLQLTEGQIGFWHMGHGDDWRQVVNADSDLLRRFAATGGVWFRNRLNEIHCPVLFTASLRDNLLHDVAAENCGMALQVPGSRVYFGTEGDHPLMWSRADEFRSVADWFINQVRD